MSHRSRIALGCGFALLVPFSTLRAADKPVKPAQTAPIPADTKNRKPIPAPAGQAKAEKTIKEVFAKEYAKLAVEDRVALARKMLSQAMETTDDAAARYVLMREARDLAAGAGEAMTAGRACELLCEEFALEFPGMLLSAMTAANHAAGNPTAWTGVAQGALAGVEQAVMADDYESAMRLATLANAAAEHARNVPLTLLTQSSVKELEILFLEFKRAQSYREDLRSNPENAEANYHVGRFVCFAKSDWAMGLAMLARGDQEQLRAIARDDLAAATDAAIQLDVAGRWWEISLNHTGIFKKHIQARAAHWYRLALPDLKGINRSVAEKRIEAIDTEVLKSRHLEPGLSAELFKGPEFNTFARVRTDPQVNFDWGESAADEALPKDNFSIRWSGVLRVGSAGKYELVVLANTGARIWLDEKKVVDAPNLTRLRNGQRVLVDVSAGLHPIRVEFWDTGGAAKMKLLWRPPGSGADEAIPAAAFFHDTSGVMSSALRK